MVDIKDLDLENFEKVIATLEAALLQGSLNDLERDGVIQRYEYTFEQAWKTIRRVLLALGRTEVSASPKPVIRDASEEGLIENATQWFGFLGACRSIRRKRKFQWRHISEEDEQKNRRCSHSYINGFFVKSDEAGWMPMKFAAGEYSDRLLESRNLSVHIYSLDEAMKVLKSAKEFLPEAKRLLLKIKGMK